MSKEEFAAAFVLYMLVAILLATVVSRWRVDPFLAAVGCMLAAGGFVWAAYWLIRGMYAV